MFCKICNENIDCNNHFFSRVHLKKVHNISPQDYYDKYIKQTGDDICHHENCSNATKFKNLQYGYSEYCCKTCLSTSASRLLKTKQTNIEKYGVESATSLPATKEKIRTTMRALYGVDHPMHIDSVKEQIKNTNISKYGGISPMASPDIRQKISETNMKKYGTACVFASPEIKTKIIDSNRSKFGTDFPQQNKTISDKSSQTKLIKFGTTNPQSLDTIKEKVRNTIWEKYGVSGSNAHPEIYDKFIATRRSNYWDVFHVKMNLKQLTPLFTKTEYSDKNITEFSFKCELCKNTITTQETNPIRIHCSCQRFRSKYEREIVDWLQEICNYDIIQNSRPHGMECDVIIPKLNLGIDFHGLYWHSDIHHERKYHQKKREHFESHGIQIIQVFENEWVNKRPLIENIIKKRMGITEERIFARKCTVRELTKKEYDLFMESNHIQGTAIASIRLGLVYDNNLVSVMSFSKSRYSKKHDWELIRFANRINTTVVGGAGKLFGTFRKTHTDESIVSYCDLRLFNGSLYTQLGFIKSHISDPDYFYFKKNTLIVEHRTLYQKHKLAKKLPIYDDTRTEYENMTINGFLRIFDAGNAVFEITNQDQSL